MYGGGAQTHYISFRGVFPHDKGDFNTTNLMTKQPILAFEKDITIKHPPQYP